MCCQRHFSTCLCWNILQWQARTLSHNAAVPALTTRGSSSPPLKSHLNSLALSSLMHFPKHKLMEMFISYDNHRCYLSPCTFVKYGVMAEPWLYCCMTAVWIVGLTSDLCKKMSCSFLSSGSDAGLQTAKQCLFVIIRSLLFYAVHFNHILAL